MQQVSNGCTCPLERVTPGIGARQVSTCCTENRRRGYIPRAVPQHQLNAHRGSCLPNAADAWDGWPQLGTRGTVHEVTNTSTDRALGPVYQGSLVGVL